MQQVLRSLLLFSAVACPFALLAYGQEAEGHAGTSSASASDGAKMSAEQWKSQIRAQKDLVRSLQSGIEKLNDSIQFAPATASPAVYSGTNARSKSSKK